MKILFFLWNPWPQYEHTRHNIWFLVGDELAKTRNCPAWLLDKQSKSLITSTNYNGEKVLLVKPQTYMNLSGQTVSSLLWYYKLTPADIVIIHDDIDLPTGTIRRKVGGSSWGQNGIKDIITKLGSDNFARIKIGIDRPSHPAADIADYVLSKLSKENLEQMRQTADHVLDKLNTHFFTKKE
jgi:PTH1 family peptidyl-tRNA hydrolase